MSVFERKILETNIPKDKNNKYLWKNSIGCYIKFQYDDICGYLYIVGKDNNMLEVSYNRKTKLIATNKILRLQIGDLLNKVTSEYLYEVGYLYTDKKGYEYVVMSCFRDKSKDNRKAYYLLCKRCKNIIYKTEADMKQGKGCAYCLNQKIKIGFNDLWTTNTELAKCLLNPEDGYKYSARSSVKLDWICQDCGEIIYGISPNNIFNAYNGNIPCHKCSSGISYPNRFMYGVLTQLKVDFETEKSFEWSDGKIYDFFC